MQGTQNWKAGLEPLLRFTSGMIRIHTILTEDILSFPIFCLILSLVYKYMYYIGNKTQRVSLQALVLLTYCVCKKNMSYLQPVYFGVMVDLSNTHTRHQIHYKHNRGRLTIRKVLIIKMLLSTQNKNLHKLSFKL